jgi:MFS family permease
MWSGLALLIVYLAVSLPLPVIATFVTEQLHFSNALGGLAVGAAFLTTIFTRGWAGRFSDKRGGQLCLFYGLALYSLAIFICFLAAWRMSQPSLALILLLVGRALLGVGESFAIVGILSWRIDLKGPDRSGLVFAVVGAVMYGSLAIGGPLGLYIYKTWGLAKLTLVCLPLPLMGWVMFSLAPKSAPRPAKQKTPFLSIIGRVWAQGTVVGLQGVGFALIGAFINRYFANKGWLGAGYALTAFGAGFVLTRLCFGRLPDLYGGYRVAVVALSLEALGQALLWLAPFSAVALGGAFLTGLGCSLVYPAMGLEIIKISAPEIRGAAVGAFAIFQDVAYGATAPVVGFFIDHFGYSIVFPLGLLAAILGLILALILKKSAYIKTKERESLAQN